MSQVILRSQIVGADSIARRLLDGARRELPNIERSGVHEIAQAAETVFQSHAPFKTGRLIRGIAAQMHGSEAVVTADAKNPETGYDYVGVTRFGHKVARIEPRSDRAEATVLASGKKRATGHKAALRFTIGGRTLYRHSVAAYHPDSDWAEDAMPEVEAEAQIVVSRLGRRLERVLDG